MNQIYALIQSDVVINTIMWDGNTATWTPPSGVTAQLLPAGSPVSAGYTFDGTNYTAPVSTTPAPTAAEVLASTVMAALAAGLTITSTSTPAINGTYAVDSKTTDEITSVTTFILTNGAFPNGTSTFPWPDASNTPHIFPSVAVFKGWATAIANYVSALNLYGDGMPGATLPAPSMTIA